MLNDIKNLCKAFLIVVQRLFELLGDFLVKIIIFLGPVANSVKGVINPEEFYRVITLALSVGGSFYGFITYISNHANDFVTDPNVVISINTFAQHCKDKQIPLAIFTAIFLGDYIRRKYIHG